MDEAYRLASGVLLQAQKRRLLIATAESCTGGLVASTITAVPGSSKVFERGFVTYSNESKVEQLSVGKETIKHYGAVSEEVIKEMVLGAIKHSKADLALAVSGIAGPGTNSQDKPEGLVWFGFKTSEKLVTKSISFGPIGRNNVRNKAVIYCLGVLLALIEGKDR